MMCEEFVRLSKVDVTGRFYRESIEPLYMSNMFADKQEFVNQWLKDNKPNIVKAHAFDIDRSSRELALFDIKVSELENLKAENSCLQYQAETWEAKFKSAHSSWQEAQHIADSWKADYYEVRKQAEQVEPLNNRIKELENEIVRLKARLFDMMEGVNVK